jgi:thiol-disulfide isomerase/thioredoxin
VLRGLFFLASLLLASITIAGGASVAPDFTLPDRNNQPVQLSDLRGQVVMLNFWASWCGPCRQEMPHLDDIYKAHAADGFTLLGINVDQQPELAERLLAQVPVTFPILMDTASDVSRLYQVDAMPTTILIDRAGQLRHIHRSYRLGHERLYREQVKALLLESVSE